MNKIIQISAGRGPEECTYVVAKVLKYLLKDCTEKKVEYTILNSLVGNQNGTLQSVNIRIEGLCVPEITNKWIGTIQWIGKSPYRSFHKRKNWFIGVFENTEIKLQSIQDKDIRYQAMRSQGAGGQHVNKVSSAIRATHLPTGTTVQVMDSRSQHQNKKTARMRLEAKVSEKQLDKIQKQTQNTWENHLQLERGNPVLVFEGTNFKKKKVKPTFKKQRASEKANWKKEAKKNNLWD